MAAKVINGVYDFDELESQFGINTDKVAGMIAALPPQSDPKQLKEIVAYSEQDAVLRMAYCVWMLNLANKR